MQEPENKINKISVLLVEDNEHDAAIFRRVCRRSDKDITSFCCESAEEALGFLKAGKEAVDIIVTDLGLPGMTGLELSKALFEKNIRKPIIVLTGAGSEGTAIDALHIGVSDYVVKDAKGDYLKSLADRLFKVYSRYIETKEQKDALREEKDQAISISLAKSEFLASMSHELRTPLNCILGFSEIIKDEMFGKVGNRYKDYAGDIYNSAMHLLGIIGDIMDITKLEIGKNDVDPVKLDLSDEIEKCFRMLGPWALEEEIDLIFENAGQKFIVVFDEKQLRQIILNLLSNSIKYTKNNGQVNVNILNGGNLVTLVIEDNGVGIPKDQLKDVMLPFKRSESQAYITKEGGIGLGLAIVNSLVKLNKGQFNLESEEGLGTKASIVIPAYDENFEKAENIQN